MGLGIRLTNEEEVALYHLLRYYNNLAFTPLTDKEKIKILRIRSVLENKLEKNIQKIEFETRTSFYELSRIDDQFTLTKKRLKDGADSEVQVGRTFIAPRRWVGVLNDYLYFGDMRTSPIVNVEEVIKFITGE